MTAVGNGVGFYSLICSLFHFQHGAAISLRPLSICTLGWYRSLCKNSSFRSVNKNIFLLQCGSAKCTKVIQPLVEFIDVTL